MARKATSTAISSKIPRKCCNSFSPQRVVAGLAAEGAEADRASAGGRAEEVQAGRALVGAAEQIAPAVCGMPANLLAGERAGLAVEVPGAPGVAVPADLVVDPDRVVAAVQDLEAELVSAVVVQDQVGAQDMAVAGDQGPAPAVAEVRAAELDLDTVVEEERVLAAEVAQVKVEEEVQEVPAAEAELAPMATEVVRDLAAGAVREGAAD